MKRALILASVASMIDQFNMSNVELLLGLGYEVDVAANFTFAGSITKERADKVKEKLEAMGVCVIDLPVPRRIVALGGILKSYRAVRKLSRERRYDLVHCHSPIGGAIARLAVRKESKKGYTKVIYTAHGFHFYKGAPKKNWLIYYPVEKLCARFTDVIVTINKEDYDLAKRKLRAGRIEYIPGVGIDTEKFGRGDGRAKRREMGIPEDAPLILSVGELNGNKNHETVIRALGRSRHTDAHYLIVGKGDLKDSLTALAKELSLEGRVHLLGYRTDVHEIYSAADIFVHPSYREGLPVAVIEAMTSGLPIVASDIRGNRDLVKPEGGRLLSPDDVEAFANEIDALIDSHEKRRAMGEFNRGEAEKYSSATVNALTEQIYK